jgi:hypothetical protein
MFENTYTGHAAFLPTKPTEVARLTIHSFDQFALNVYIHGAAPSCAHSNAFWLPTFPLGRTTRSERPMRRRRRQKPASGSSRNAVERTLKSNNAAYCAAAANSEAIRQAVIRRADDDYRTIADDAPKLVKEASTANHSETVAAALSEVSGFADKATAAWENAVRSADEQHHDRLAAARRHYGIVNGMPLGSDPNAEHAWVWLEELLKQWRECGPPPFASSAKRLGRRPMAP